MSAVPTTPSTNMKFIMYLLGFFSTLRPVIGTNAAFSRSNTRLDKRLESKNMEDCHEFLKESDADDNGHLSASEYMEFLERIMRQPKNGSQPSGIPGRLEKMMTFNRISYQSETAKAKTPVDKEDGARSSSSHIWLGANDVSTRQSSSKLRSRSPLQNASTEHLNQICSELLQSLSIYGFHSEL